MAASPNPHNPRTPPAASRDRSELDELKGLLPRCLLPDQVRIGSQLLAALRSRQGPAAARLPLARWLAQARASIQARQARATVLAHLAYPAELPITAHRDQLLAAIRAHPVVVVAGETGSGKTTQLPKLCLEAGLGLRARIGCTQPRRVAAQSISMRLAEELGVEWGRAVGCKIRFADDTHPATSVKVMTDGILLAEIQGDPLLAEYEALVLDEAHERSLNIDFLLGYLKLLLAKRDDLKLIVTSATIDTERFARAFHGAPVLTVSGRLYPVEVRYSPLDEHAQEEGEVTYIDAAVNVVDDLLAEAPAGDLLVFMPTERDIRETCDRLATRYGPKLEVVPLFGRLTATEQQRVFAPGARRRAVVATNIAETSLTVPRIRYVIDTGLARLSRYHPGTRSQRLPIEPIAQSSARQRQGRCGRVADGVCVRLFSEADFQARPPYLEPEIQRCDLADVILRMKAFRLGDIETFPFLDPPAPAAIAGAYQLLQELDALDRDRNLTALGQDLARLPIDPTMSRMIIEAHRTGALPEVLVIAAGLSVPDPRERPLDQRDAAEAAHRRFLHPHSDFLALANIWRAYHETWESLKTQNQLRKFCKTHFLSFARMRDWVDLHAQLADAVAELRPPRAQPARAPAAAPTQSNPSHSQPAPDTLPARAPGGADPPSRRSPFDARYAAIHRAILTGLLGHVALRQDKNLYRLGGGKQAMVFPGSGLFEKPAPRSTPGSASAPPSPRTPARPSSAPDWLIAGELVETSRLFLRMVAAIEPTWILELAPHLVKLTYEPPQWDRASGRVVCTEKASLRGLVLRERRVSYAQVNPAEATACFIRAALIAEDLEDHHRAKFDFLDSNRRLREKIEVWQTRLPHRVVPDLDQALFDFYAQRLAAVGSIHDLSRWLKTQTHPRSLAATTQDLLGPQADTFDHAAFPDAVSVRGELVPVAYAYAPGEERDGVTLRLTVPLAELADLERLDWLVPALREARVTQLLQRLPKDLRRPLMPLNHAAREIVAHTDPQAPSFLAALSQFVLHRYGVSIPVSAWPLADLPPHLRPRLEIVGQTGQTLAAGRDLAQLRAQLRAQHRATEAEDWPGAAQNHERYDLVDWDFADLPERVWVSEAAGFPRYAYPGLHLENHAVNLRLFRQPEEAIQATRSATPRLAARVLHRELNWLQKDLRALSQHGVLYATLGSREELLETAWENLRRHLFPEPDPVPRTSAAFAQYVAAARRLIPGLTQKFLALLGTILQRRQEILLCRQPFPTLPNELEALVPPQFLLRIPFADLEHLPRYLQALRIRAERAALNPAKDREKAQRLAPYLRAAAELRAQPATNPSLQPYVQAFLRLVEEFKVSVFAQEMGTALPVSPKRLDEALERIRQHRAGTPR